MLGGGVEGSLTRASLGDLRLAAGQGHRGACDQYSLVSNRISALGDARGGVGKLGGKSFPPAQSPRLFLITSFFAATEHPQNTSTHTLLWLVIAVNFVKLQPLGTKSSPFPPSLSCLPSLPGARPEGVLGPRTWALRGQFPKVRASPCWDVSLRQSTRLPVTQSVPPRKALMVTAAWLGRALADSPAAAPPGLPRAPTTAPHYCVGPCWAQAPVQGCHPFAQPTSMRSHFF